MTRIDVTRFGRFLRGGLKSAIIAGARTGVQDVIDEWKRETIDVAPIDTATLRRGVTAELERGGSGDMPEGFVTANAIESTGSGRFNYAYYIHEVAGGNYNLRTPGTIKKFIEKPLNDNREKWIGDIEAAINEEVMERVRRL